MYNVTHLIEEASMNLVSCQIIGIPKEIWKLLRQECIEQEISVNKKLLQLITEEVARNAGPAESNRSNEK